MSTVLSIYAGVIGVQAHEPQLTEEQSSASHTISLRVTAIGGGTTFYDNLVDVRVV